MNDLIKILKKKKEENNLTLVELEKLIGIDRQTIWRWLAGKNKPSRLASRAIENFLNS